ncbi:hypothetical protein V8F33_005765 [Rhypophila sp. PSN 637]
MTSTNDEFASVSAPKLNADVLLIHMPFEPDNAWIAKVEARYPGFKVRWYSRPWGFEKIALPEEAYKGVTMLCSPGEPPADLPKLRYVQIAQAGADAWINTPLYKNSKVVFCTANGTHPPQIAEWVIGTYLQHAHHLLSYFAQQQASPTKPQQKLLNLQVQDSPGLRMGILGYGAIGRQVARIAQALGMEVYAYTRREKPTPESRKDDSYLAPGVLGDPEGIIPTRWFHGGSKADTNNFLSQNLDVVVISLPLTPETKGMMSKEQFDILEQTSLSKNGGTGRKTFISNIGRGEIIDTDALVDALKTDKIRGAALDVTDPEPLPEGHELLKMMVEEPGKIFVTPHVSWQTPHYFERVLGILERNLEVLLDDGTGSKDETRKPLLNVIDRVHHY